MVPSLDLYLNPLSLGLLLSVLAQVILNILSNVNECLKLWKFDYEIVKSLTDVNSVIVKINNLKKI